MSRLKAVGSTENILLTQKILRILREQAIATRLLAVTLLYLIGRVAAAQYT